MRMCRAELDVTGSCGGGLHPWAIGTLTNALPPSASVGQFGERPAQRALWACCDVMRGVHMPHTESVAAKGSFRLQGGAAGARVRQSALLAG